MYVSLTGGLGNQLFQLAAGISFTKGDDVVLVTNLGAPRSTEGIVDLLHYSLPTNVKVMEFSGFGHNWLAKKVAGHTLRRGISPSELEKVPVVANLLNMAASTYLSIGLKEFKNVWASDQVGFTELIPKKDSFIFGYFQSYKYFESVQTILKKSLKVRSPSPSMTRWVECAEKTKPIVIHVRLTDYLQERNFGTLSAEYYGVAVECLLSSIGKRELWLFSDDKESAVRRLPQELVKRVRVFDDSNLRPVEILEIMRCGAAYVLANSSFSWWAAALARRDVPKVIVPRKWFAGMDDPVDLIPKNWDILDA